MSGRVLTERLLATTSLAALILAGANHQAQASACTVVATGQAYSNSGSIGCVAAPNSSVSITNTKTGTISSTSTAAVSVTGTLSGGIVNAGTIVAHTADAIAVTGLVQGGISNSGTISIAEVGGAVAYNNAIDINAASFVGGVTNSGTISLDQTDGLASTQAAIYVNVGTFTGNIVNTGTISWATTNEDDASLYGVTINGATFAGSISNGGTISLTSHSTGSSSAHAIGLAIDVGTFTGNIVNSGSIALTVTGGSATATGIDISAASFGSNAAGGGIVNTGTISASATATGGCCGSANAYARGITVDAGLFQGGITNSGSVIATATANGTSGANAYATGIYAYASTFTGGIANSGLISATASAGTTSGSCNCASAQARAINVEVSNFSGGITNSGSLIAKATATASGFESAAAYATGLNVFANTFAGGIANSGLISSTASTTACCGSAMAVGVNVEASSFGGGFTNSGTITAHATLSTAGSGSAVAIGVQFEGLSTAFSASIVNSGLISATASMTGNGGGCCGRAIARGINLLDEGSATLNNSGTIIATASSNTTATAIGVAVTGFSATIVNSGTIAGLITGTRSGYGVGIAFSNGAHGTITNTGLIEGSSWGIDLSNEGAASTINLAGGAVDGGFGVLPGCGGAILLSSHQDIVNITGGTVVGNIEGENSSPTSGNVINVNMGTGTFGYAGEIYNVGVVNLQSGTFLLQNLTANTPTVSTTNYNQAAGSTLAIQVANANNMAGQLSASGTITLASGSNFQAFEGALAWKPGQTFTYADVVQGGTITGSFTNAYSNSPLFTAVLTQTTTADSLTLTVLNPSQVPGLNGNQQSVANAIINIPGGNSVLDQMFELNSSQLGTALTQLSGSQYTQTNYQPLLDSWQTFTDTLSNRLAAGEGYDDPMDASYSPGGGLQFAQADIPQQVAQVSDGISGMRGPQRWGAWMRGYGLTASGQATPTSSSFSESGAGLIAGADKQFTDKLVAGVAVNIATDKANNTGGGSTLTNAYQGSAYGQYQMDDNWYINGLAGFGWQTYKSARLVTLVTPTIDNGSYDGQSYRLYGESGYTLRPAYMGQSNTRITPFVGLGYLHTHTGAFTENGPTALSVQSEDQNSFTTILGARAAAMWQVGSTIFQPNIHAGWQHEWLDDVGTITAAFAQAPSSVFTATGTSLGRDYFVGGAGLTTAITASTQIFLDYDAKANGSYTAQAISGGLRVDF